MGPEASPWMLWLAVLWASCCPAQDWLGDGRLDIQKAKVPVYLNFEPKPAAMFRAERVYNDYQTRGFFKIGLLRMVVLEKLSLELLDPARLAATLQDASGQFAVKAGVKKAVEGRDFSLFFASENSGRLTARRVRLENRAAWRLEEGLITLSASPSIAFRRGTLTLAGPKTGEFVCDTTKGSVHFQLLSLVP